MSLAEVLAALEAAGSQQTRKTYARHGVTGPMFGVSYATLGTLTKKLKRDQTLAEGLWKSGNHDARVLATMIADPERITTKTVDAWAKDINGHVLGGAVAKLVAQTEFAVAKSQKWRAAKNHTLACTGWTVIAHLALAENDCDELMAELLKQIATTIHAQPNRVRHAMNNALIAIGVRNPTLTKQALAVAKKIGVVEVDHGDTACQTPDATAYIHKTLAHRAKKGKGKKTGTRKGC